MHKSHFFKLTAFLFCINIFIMFTANIILADSLPTFAVVEESISTEDKKYITSESSIQTVATPTFSFNSKAQILMEQSTGKILYQNNETEKLFPASVTKVMTLLLIMEQLDSGALKLEDTVTCSANASKIGGSQIWFKEGEQLTIDEALKCICVVSANDVCIAMAELIGGSEENFVQMMNDKAASLGMENTHFMNAHGIDEDNHYSCAKDIAIMSRELMTKHPNITKYTTIWMDSIRNGEFNLANTNKLLKSYTGITGLKTGSTSAAGFNLSATATKSDLSLIAVVLGAPSSDVRNNEITQLLNYGFSSYSVKTYAKAGDTITSIKINKNIKDIIDIVYKEDVTHVVEKGTVSNLTQDFIIMDNLVAPLNSGSTVGKVVFKNEDGSTNCEVDAIITTDVSHSNLMDYMKHVFYTYIVAGLG